VARTPGEPAAAELRQLGLPALDVEGDEDDAASAIAKRVRLVLSRS
jgi:hypothetical protein